MWTDSDHIPAMHHFIIPRCMCDKLESAGIKSAFNAPCLVKQKENGLINFGKLPINFSGEALGKVRLEIQVREGIITKLA